MFRPDDKIGPYSLVRQLGRGAFGVVWLAEKRTAIATTNFALKVAIDQEPDLDAIRQEASLWKQAGGHPNVLPIIEADIYDGYVVIVSEYAPHGSLEDRLTQSGRPLAIDKSAEIVSGVLGGLQHLHIQGIIHRDLKPANILFQGETPRLADFGIARVLKTNSYSATVAGTPAYMAPEVFDGKRSVQTDIWAAGVILYRLVSGRLPYPQSDLMALLAAIVSRDADPLPSSIPSPIQEIITRAINRDTTQRYKSATEMRKALRDASRNDALINSIDPPTLIEASFPPKTAIVTTTHDDDLSTLVRPVPVANPITPQRLEVQLSATPSTIRHQHVRIPFEQRAPASNHVPRVIGVFGLLLVIIFGVVFVANRRSDTKSDTGAALETAMKPNAQVIPSSKPEVKVKAQIIPSSRPEIRDSFVTAKGAVDNISDEPLENLTIEISLQRGGDGPPETRVIPVTPNPLAPRERGFFEFEYYGKRDTGFAGYTITRLLSNGTPVGFRQPGQK
jgi:serine/threonine protein kinase